MINVDEANDKRNALRRNDQTRAASASGISSFKSVSPAGRPTLRTTEQLPHAEIASGDGKFEFKPLRKVMPMSPAASAALASAASEHITLRKVQAEPRGSQTAIRTPFSPSSPSSLAVASPTSSSVPALSSSKETTSPLTSTLSPKPASSSTLPGPLKPTKPPKQDYGTVDFAAADPTSPTMKPSKPPKTDKLGDSHLSDSKPIKPAKSGATITATTAATSSTTASSDEKPSKPPKAIPTDFDDAPSPSSSSSATTPSSKPARPKRIIDDDPPTPKGEERGSSNKPRIPPRTEDKEEDSSVCSNSSSSGVNSRNSTSKPESLSSLSKYENASRAGPVESASSDEDVEEPTLSSDTTHTNRYGVTVVAGKALKVLGVSTPSGAMSRPGTKSPMHISKPNNLISENGNSNVIHYTTKAASVFTDYDFKNEEHQILSYIRLGKTSAVCAALLDCSVDQFCKLIPVVACAIAETPGWATEVSETLVAAVKQRIATSPAINQAVHFLKVSRLLSYPWAYNHWLSSLQTSSYLLEVCELLATREVGFEFKVPEGKKLFHPFQAGFTITSWQVTKIFNSNAKPRLVVPSGRLESDKTSPTHSLVAVCGNPFIIKYGDDVRQDVAVVHIMCMMNNLWASSNLVHEGCPVKSMAYGCLALSDTLGCIEYVPNALPLRLVSQAGRYSSTAINRMITSGAGSFVAAYILGVRDRHFDNILVSKHDGALFHIDFGRILGDQTTIDTGAFAITPDLKEVITSFGDDKWDVFVQLCLIAYKTIRDNNRLIISFTSMLMAPFQSQETVRNFIAQRLRLQLEDEVAMAKIRKKVSTAPTRWKTKFKNVVHGIATGD